MMADDTDNTQDTADTTNTEDTAGTEGTSSPDQSAQDRQSLYSAIYANETNSGRNVHTSSAGAVGPMQIMPATFAKYAQPGEDINNPDDNMAVGHRIIDDLYQRYGGNKDAVLVGYNAGENHIGQPFDQLPRETQNYIAKAHQQWGDGQLGNSAGGPNIEANMSEAPSNGGTTLRTIAGPRAQRIGAAIGIPPDAPIDLTDPDTRQALKEQGVDADQFRPVPAPQPKPQTPSQPKAVGPFQSNYDAYEAAPSDRQNYFLVHSAEGWSWQHQAPGLPADQDPSKPSPHIDATVQDQAANDRTINSPATYPARIVNGAGNIGAAFNNQIANVVDVPTKLADQAVNAVAGWMGYKPIIPYGTPAHDLMHRLGFETEQRGDDGWAEAGTAIGNGIGAATTMLAGGAITSAIRAGEAAATAGAGARALGPGAVATPETGGTAATASAGAQALGRGATAAQGNIAGNTLVQGTGLGGGVTAGTVANEALAGGAAGLGQDEAHQFYKGQTGRSGDIGDFASQLIGGGLFNAARIPLFSAAEKAAGSAVGTAWKAARNAVNGKAGIAEDADGAPALNATTGKQVTDHVLSTQLTQYLDRADQTTAALHTVDPEDSAGYLAERSSNARAAVSQFAQNSRAEERGMWNEVNTQIPMDFSGTRALYQAERARHFDGTLRSAGDFPTWLDPLLGKSSGNPEAAPASTLGSVNPAPGSTISSSDYRAMITAHGGNMGDAADTLTNQVSQALADGRSVTYHIEGKAVPIVSVDRGMMADAQGQRWGTLGLTSTPNRLEIGPAKTPGVQPPLGFSILGPDGQPIPRSPTTQPAAAADAPKGLADIDTLGRGQNVVARLNQAIEDERAAVGRAQNPAMIGYLTRIRNSLRDDMQNTVGGVNQAEIDAYNRAMAFSKSRSQIMESPSMTQFLSTPFGDSTGLSKFLRQGPAGAEAVKTLVAAAQEKYGSEGLLGASKDAIRQMYANAVAPNGYVNLAAHQKFMTNYGGVLGDPAFADVKQQLETAASAESDANNVVGYGTRGGFGATPGQADARKAAADNYLGAPTEIVLRHLEGVTNPNHATSRVLAQLGGDPTGRASLGFQHVIAQAALDNPKWAQVPKNQGIFKAIDTVNPGFSDRVAKYTTPSSMAGLVKMLGDLGTSLIGARIGGHLAEHTGSSFVMAGRGAEITRTLGQQVKDWATGITSARIVDPQADAAWGRLSTNNSGLLYTAGQKARDMTILHAYVPGLALANLPLGSQSGTGAIGSPINNGPTLGPSGKPWWQDLQTPLQSSTPQPQSSSAPAAAPQPTPGSTVAPAAPAGWWNALPTRR